MLHRRIKLLIGCAALLLFVLGGIGAFNVRRYLSAKSERESFSRKIAVEVERKWSSDNSSPIRLKDLTDFPWDRVHIFTPYQATETIDENLGYVWQPARSIGLYQRDDVNLLVFTNNGQVVFYVKHERHLGDFKGNYKKGGYSSDEAIFQVVEWGTHSQGRPWLRLKWEGSAPKL